MNIKAFIFVLFAGGLLLNACQKNTDIFIPDRQTNGPDTNWHSYSYCLHAGFCS